jgi:hypothetical protein
MRAEGALTPTFWWSSFTGTGFRIVGRRAFLANNPRPPRCQRSLYMRAIVRAASFRLLVTNTMVSFFSGTRTSIRVNPGLITLDSVSSQD